MKKCHKTGGTILFNTTIYVFLLEGAMYSYCCLCILIVNLCILIVVYVLSMYS